MYLVEMLQSFILEDGGPSYLELSLKLIDGLHVTR